MQTKHIIYRTKELGMPVYRLIVWVDGSLQLVSTWHSLAGARSKLAEKYPAYFARLQAASFHVA